MSYDQEDVPEWFSGQPRPIQQLLAKFGVFGAQQSWVERGPAYQPAWAREAGEWRSMGFAAVGAGLAPSYAYGLVERAYRAGMIPPFAGGEDWTYRGREAYYALRAGAAYTPDYAQRMQANQAYWRFQQEQWTKPQMGFTAARLGAYVYPELWGLRAFGYAGMSFAQRVMGAEAVAPFMKGMSPQQAQWTSGYWMRQPAQWGEIAFQSIGGWTVAQSFGWAVSAALEAPSGGRFAAAGRSMLSSLGIQMMQPALDIYSTNLGALYAAQRMGQPMSPEEMRTIQTQNRLASGMLGGGLGWQESGAAGARILGDVNRGMRAAEVGVTTAAYFAGYAGFRELGRRLGAPEEYLSLIGFAGGQATALGVSYAPRTDWGRNIGVSLGLVEGRQWWGAHAPWIGPSYRGSTAGLQTASFKEAWDVALLTKGSVFARNERAFQTGHVFEGEEFRVTGSKLLAPEPTRWDYLGGGISALMGVGFGVAGGELSARAVERLGGTPFQQEAGRLVGGGISALVGPPLAARGVQAILTKLGYAAVRDATGMYNISQAVGWGERFSTMMARQAEGLFEGGIVSGLKGMVSGAISRLPTTLLMYLTYESIMGYMQMARDYPAEYRYAQMMSEGQWAQYQRAGDIPGNEMPGFLPTPIHETVSNLLGSNRQATGDILQRITAATDGKEQAQLFRQLKETNPDLYNKLGGANLETQIYKQAVLGPFEERSFRMLGQYLNAPRSTSYPSTWSKMWTGYFADFNKAQLDVFNYSATTGDYGVSLSNLPSQLSGADLSGVEVSLNRLRGGLAPSGEILIPGGIGVLPGAPTPGMSYQQAISDAESFLTGISDKGRQPSYFAGLYNTNRVAYYDTLAIMQRGYALDQQGLPITGAAALDPIRAAALAGIPETRLHWQPRAGEPGNPPARVYAPVSRVDLDVSHGVIASRGQAGGWVDYINDLAAKGAISEEDYRASFAMEHNIRPEFVGSEAAFQAGLESGTVPQGAIRMESAQALEQWYQERGYRQDESGNWRPTQHGFSRLVTRPTRMLVGESGAEVVTITPAASAAAQPEGLSLDDVRSVLREMLSEIAPSSNYGILATTEGKMEPFMAKNLRRARSARGA